MATSENKMSDFRKNEIPDKTVDGERGQFRGGYWTPENWQSAAQNQAFEARNARRSANEAYRQNIGDFGQNMSNQINAIRDKQYGAVLSAANYALKNGGMTPMTMIDVLGNDLNGPNGNFVGAAFRGKGKGARFTVFLRDQNGQIRPGMQLSMADIFKMNNQQGGGYLDDDALAIGNAQMGKYMTPQQIADATDASQLESLRERVTGAAGGREFGGTTDGRMTSRLFGRGGDPHSRISFFGTGGAGTGYTMRVADGHTGEDTGFVDDQIRQGRTAELAKGRWKVVSVGPSDDGKTQVRVYENEQTGERRTVRDGQGLPQTQEAVELAEATRRGKGGRTFDEEKELARIRSENRIKESEAAQAGREKIEGLKTERDRERQRSLYKKSLGTIKIKTVTGERTLTPEEISDAMKNWDEDNPAPQGGQATSSRVDNSGSEKWGSLTPAQIEKVKAKGGTYDEKTGEIVLPNGKRMKV